jgi:hypothetical protein
MWQKSRCRECTIKDCLVIQPTPRAPSDDIFLMSKDIKATHPSIRCQSTMSQFTISLRAESMRMQEATGNDIIKQVHATVRMAFARNNIPTVIPRLRLTTHTRWLGDGVTNTALKHFFPEQMQGAKVERIDMLEVEQAQHGMLFKVTTQYGPFWVCANISSDDATLRLIDIGPITVQARLTRITQDAPPALILTHIDPYTCLFCGSASTHKCKKCWDNLNISVRYCGKECQRAHFQQGHKRVCGKKG